MPAKSFRIGDSFAIPECICGAKPFSCIVTITGTITVAVTHRKPKPKSRAKPKRRFLPTSR